MLQQLYSKLCPNPSHMSRIVLPPYSQLNTADASPVEHLLLDQHVHVNQSIAAKCSKPMYQAWRIKLHSKFSEPLLAGRSVLAIAGTVQGHRVLVATSHLESPCGSNQMYSKERKAQFRDVSSCSSLMCQLAVHVVVQ